MTFSWKRINLALMLVTTISSESWAHAEGPLGKTAHDWHPDAAIKSVFSINFDFHAGNNFVSWSDAGRIERREGKSCLVSPYVMFDIKESFAFNIDETIYLDLLFYRPETDGFILSYDQAIEPTAMQVRFKENTEKEIWHKETVRLDRARFANRKYYGSDLSIGGIGSQLFHPPGRGKAVLCGMTIRREAKALPPIKKATLSLNVNDENGHKTPARIGLYRADGWAPLTGATAIPIQRYTEYTQELPMHAVPSGWSEKGRYAFFIDGNYKSEVPAGEYHIFVMKGPEYEIYKSKITFTSGETQDITVDLKRFDNLPARGWLSGDDHIHIGRASPEKNKSILNFMKAEDLHVANILEAGNINGSFFKQYGYGQESVYSQDGYYLVTGQESPRTSHRGHTIGLNVKKFYEPKTEYFLYDDTSDHIRADGGLWGYAHVAIDAFNVFNGLALDVPRGKVDFLEMMQYGMMNTSYLYDFLNMGFKLSPSAGSDYPYINFPGSERLYVQHDGAVTSQSWFANLKSGRSFVTNWMSIEDMTVNGDRQSGEYDIKSGETVTIKALIKVNPDFDDLDRVELVRHGDVIYTAPVTNNSPTLNFSHSFTPKTSMWLAIRAYGKAGALLHTAPIYVYVDNNRDFSDINKRRGLAEKNKDILLKFRDSSPSLDVEFERFAVEDMIIPKWQQSRKLLGKAIDEAIIIYDRIIQKEKNN